MKLSESDTRSISQKSVLRRPIANDGKAEVILGQRDFPFFTCMGLQAWWSSPINHAALAGMNGCQSAKSRC